MKRLALLLTLLCAFTAAPAVVRADVAWPDRPGPRRPARYYDETAVELKVFINDCWEDRFVLAMEFSLPDGGQLEYTLRDLETDTLVQSEAVPFDGEGHKLYTGEYEDRIPGKGETARYLLEASFVRVSYVDTPYGKKRRRQRHQFTRRLTVENRDGHPILTEIDESDNG